MKVQTPVSACCKTEKSEKLQTINAVVLFPNFQSEHNIPIAVNDHYVFY